MTAPTVWEHGVAALVGLVLPLAGLAHHLRGQGGEPEVFEPGEKIATYWINGAFLLLLAGAAAAAWRHAGRSWAALGLAAPAERVGLGVLLGLGAVLAHALDAWWNLSSPERLAATRRRWRRDSPFLPATARELRHSGALLVGAAVGEEIAYRGFLIGYALALLGSSRWGVLAAVALPALAFGLVHLWQGAAAAAKIFVFALWMGAVLLSTGSLWIPIAVHFVVDLVGMRLGSRLLAEPRVPEAAVELEGRKS